MLSLRRLGFGKARESETLERRVSNLQTALSQCAEVARRWTYFRREVSVGIAVLMLALGFMLGVYRDPLKQAVTGAAQSVGIARPAPDADTAYTAYQNGKYAVALRLAQPLAADGDAAAQFVLGLLYNRGRGVPQDLNEAVTWLRRAADQGNAAAQVQLGTMFYEGQGVPQNYDEAAKWYRRAADQGDAQAQYNLGLAYAKGEAGDADNVSAYMWFNLAAASFSPSDTRRTAAVTSRDLVANKMTREQIVEAQKRARDWKPK